MYFTLLDSKMFQLYYIFKLILNKENIFILNFNIFCFNKKNHLLYSL